MVFYSKQMLVVHLFSNSTQHGIIVVDCKIISHLRKLYRQTPVIGFAFTTNAGCIFHIVFSISDDTSFRMILWGLDATRLIIGIITSLRNLQAPKQLYCRDICHILKRVKTLNTPRSRFSCMIRRLSDNKTISVSGLFPLFKHSIQTFKSHMLRYYYNKLFSHHVCGYVLSLYVIIKNIWTNNIQLFYAWYNCLI